MILLDGRALSQKLLAEVKAEIGERKLKLAAIKVGEYSAITKFLAQKKKTAEELGVDFRIYDYPADISTNELRKRIAVVVHEADPDGIIIQLPLPGHINTQHILNSVPPAEDVDLLSARAVGDFAVGKSRILPPVVGAIKALFKEYGIDYRSRHAVMVGAGRLVGKPVAAWLTNEKVSFTVVDENTSDISEFIKKADIIITGVGKPGLITGDMVKEGAVVIDAGTSAAVPSLASLEEAKLGTAKHKLVGDVDFDSVSKKASYITPMPGGVGPLTVAMIFKNLLTLAKTKRA